MPTPVTATQLNMRPGHVEDAETLGRICFEAFAAIADAHSFPRDFPSADVGTGFMTMMLSRPDIYSVVAEEGGRIVGSNFLWKSDAVAGVGPITVDPAVQNSKIGRALMEDVMRHADENGTYSVRLLQSAYHNRSLALYTKLGFRSCRLAVVYSGNTAQGGYRGLSSSASGQRRSRKNGRVGDAGPRSHAS
jgi:ribosomal protein S18 acetylase RimI-like enzyme